jgi:hypothetical protein
MRFFHAPGRRVFQQGMKDFANAGGIISFLFKILRKGYDLFIYFTEMSGLIPDLDAVGPFSRQDTGPGGITNACWQ